MINEEQMRAVQTAIISHCELMGDRMAILTLLPASSRRKSGNGVNTARYDSKFATLYYP